MAPIIDYPKFKRLFDHSQHTLYTVWYEGYNKLSESIS